VVQRVPHEQLQANFLLLVGQNSDSNSRKKFFLNKNKMKFRFIVKKIKTRIKLFFFVRGREEREGKREVIY